MQAWPDDPPVETIQAFVDKHIVDRSVTVYNALQIDNSDCGTQKLRCFSGLKKFSGSNKQDVVGIIPSKVPAHARKQWKWKPQEPVDVGRLLKLFEVMVNPSDSTKLDIRRQSLAYVSYFDRSNNLFQFV